MSWKREKPSALNYSVHYLSYRPRSVAEVVLALKKKNYLPEEIEETIQLLLEKGFLNDNSFAESWIHYRKNQSVRSRSFVRQELQTKGIAASIIEESLQEYYPPEEERAVLAPLLQKQWQSLKNKMMPEAEEEAVSREKIMDKLLRKYAGKGFSPYLVRDVLTDVMALTDDETTK